MRLRKYPPMPPPAIKLKQRSINKLIELYHEMVNVYKGDIVFNQNDCSSCVIGNGIRAGILNTPKSYGTEPEDKFSPAVLSIGLPNGDYYEVVSEFLFSGIEGIVSAGEFLRLHVGRERKHPRRNNRLDELDACVRIAGVLDRAGYDISELPSLPSLPRA